ncbi:MAG: EAL domain-containing protein [Desulfarculus sp.]|nr:EAL domain-containing protein [Desulfarculus sp.]
MPPEPPAQAPDLLRQLDEAQRRAARLEKELEASQERLATLRDLMGPEGQASLALERLLLREAHYRTLFETANDAILILADGRILDCNPRALELFAASRQALVGFALTDLSPPAQAGGQDSLEAAQALASQALAGHPQNFAWRFQGLGQQPLEAEVSLNRLVLAGQDYLLAVVRDVTARCRTEESLRVSEERFRNLSENAPDIIYTLGQDGAFTYVNPAWRRILGHAPGEVLGHFFVDFVLPAERPYFREAFRRIRDQHEILQTTRCLLHKDGGQRLFSMSGSPNLDARGQVTGMVGMLKDVTKRAAAEQALRKSQASLARAQKMAHLGNWEMDLATNQMTCSEEVFCIYGIGGPQAPVSLRSFMLSVHPADREMVRRHLDMVPGMQGPLGLEHRIVRPDGQTRVVYQLAELVRDDKGQPKALVGAVQDITERKRSEEHMNLLARVFENTVEGILVTDGQGVIRMINRAFTTITGFCPEEAIGQTPRLLSSHRQGPEFYQAMWQDLKEQGHWQGEIWNRRKNGEAFPEWLTITAIKDPQGEVSHYVGVFHDITEIKRSEEQISFQAYHDALTGLPNRLLFNDRLGMALAHAQRQNEGLAVLFLDLDNFKNINDSLGHAMGDQLLQAVARRLVRWVRDEDTVARLGGDEFIMLLPGANTPDYAVQVASRVLETMAEPLRVRGQEFYLTASIGITLYPHDGADAETLVAGADTAMYRAKADGRNNYKLFTPAMNQQVVRRMDLERSLRRALRQGEFVMHYQPKVELASGEVVGVEALIRWQRPGVGLVQPAEFIPVAEETGLIVPIGEWVLFTACRCAQNWRQQGFSHLRVAVNISPRQFRQRNLVQMVGRALAESGLPPQCLELEVTESVVMHSVEEAIATLSQLHGLGVQLFMDDFGRGYSSLYHLKRFPMHALKIDRSFVSDIATNPGDASIVDTIISMSRSLNLKVVAEGVETQEQLNFLKGLRCDQMQGFLFSKPLPAEELQALLKRRQPRQQD